MFIRLPARPGISLHDELALFVDDVGLSPLEALQAATLRPAQVFGLSDTLGKVEEGMLADLVLLRENPLRDIHATRAIEAVVLNGKYWNRRSLDRLLSDASGGQ